MEIKRFALGFRFDPAKVHERGGEDAVVGAFLAAAQKRLAGMQLYCGHCRADETDETEKLTLVTMGQGIKKTKALYRCIAESDFIVGMLDPHKPVILTNAIARLEGMELIGQFDKRGLPIPAKSGSDTESGQAGGDQ